MYDLVEQEELVAHGREIVDAYLEGVYGEGAPDVPAYVLDSKHFHRKAQRHPLELTGRVEVGFFSPHRNLLQGMHKAIYLEDQDEHRAQCVPRYQRMRDEAADDPWDPGRAAAIDRQLAFWDAMTPEVVTVHEYAHAFLDDFTGNPTYKDELTSEGFATFTEMNVLEGSGYFDEEYIASYKAARLPALMDSQREGMAKFQRLQEESPSPEFFAASVRRLGERKGWFSRVWIDDYMASLDEVSPEELATANDMYEIVTRDR